MLGGADGSLERLRAWGMGADRVFAADGGADRALAAGLMPEVIVGDLDSVSSDALSCGARVVRLPEQDRTDCDKLLAFADQEGIHAIALEGVEGDRMDHLLGTLGSCVRAPVAVRLVLRQGVGTVLRPGEVVHAPAEPDALVAMIPLMPCSGARLQGVQWPLEGASMDLGGLVSVSNRATAPVVLTSIESGAALLIVGGEGPRW